MTAVTKTTTAGFSLAPANMTEAMRFAEMLAGSTMVPRDYQGKPANVLIAVQWGYEVGLGPLQAIQNIAVINGRPSLWGDAALALVRGHPACARVTEGVEGDGEARHGYCEIERRGEPPQRRTFSVSDAKKAGLWGKSGPWTQYPDRMLQLRARGFAIRDVFPDALRGVITAEEAQDMPAEPRHVPNLAPETPREPTPSGSMREAVAAQTKPLLTAELTVAEVPVAEWAKECEAIILSMHDEDSLNEWWTGMEPMIAGPNTRAKVAAMVADKRGAFAGETV
jgi:hypothetical protein